MVQRLLIIHTQTTPYFILLRTYILVTKAYGVLIRKNHLHEVQEHQFESFIKAVTPLGVCYYCYYYDQGFAMLEPTAHG